MRRTERIFIKEGQIMESTRTRKFTTSIAVLFLTALLSVLLVPGTVFASDKAARLKVSYFPQSGKEDVAEEEWNRNSYQFEVTMKTKTALKKQNYISAKILVPKSIFKIDGETVSFKLNMSAMTKEKGKYVTRYYCESYYWFSLQVFGKKTKLLLIDELTGKEMSAKKYVSVKKKGKYYVLTFKNIPVCRLIYDQKLNQELEYSDPRWKPSSEKFFLTPVLFYSFNFGTKGTGYVYLDEVSAKAKKTRKVTFNKVNYPRLVAFNLHKRKNMKVKRVNP